MAYVQDIFFEYPQDMFWLRYKNTNFNVTFSCGGHLLWHSIQEAFLTTFDRYTVRHHPQFLFHHI